MSSANTVCHPGIVQAIEQSMIRVSILSKSACGSCNVKGLCSLSESEEKTIDIYGAQNTGSFAIGDKVEVIMQSSKGMKAMFLGYILPFILVFLTLILLISFTGNEMLAGLISLAVLAPYYILLYFFGSVLKKTFSFTLRKIINQ